MRRILPRLIAAITAAAALCLASVPAWADSSETAPAFTVEEQNYIASHPVVKIGYVQDRIPVSFTDDNGEFAGISRYIFDRVASLCGLEFEYLPLPRGDVTYEYLLEGGYDLVSSVEYNKENQQARGILISDPYFSSRKVVVAREGLNFRFDAALTIAISTGSQTIRKVLGASYPNFELVDYPTITDCFDAVNSGKADLLMQNQYVVEHWLSKPIYEKLSVIPVLGLDDELCFSAVVTFGDYTGGASQEEGELLISILNKAISQLTEDEISLFIISAISENPYRYNFSDFLYRYRMAVRVFAASAVIILLLLFLLLRLYMRYSENRADARVKSRFLSTMSHEFRTPLNGIMGLNYLMLQKTDDAESLKKYLKQSNVTANYLFSLVNDMLDMSNLQTENLRLDIKPLDLGLLLDTVDSISENALRDKNIEYVKDFELICRRINGDGVRIQQVLLNLLDNAKKFTQEGGKVSFKLRQTETPDGKIMTSATVADNGKGMNEEFQRHLFDAFERELEIVSKGNQGTGLGLPISRRLARLMGGDITFESRKGAGSTFTFTFTAEPAPETDENGSGDEPAPERGALQRILVAEDNELNAEIIIELLNESGYETELAENGRIALEKFEFSEEGHFGLILMDILMPELSGCEAARAIRALPRADAKNVRIFACTANSSDEDREKALASGMDDFITKPVDLDVLLKKIRG